MIRMFGGFRKAIISAALLALAISAYSVLFKPMYDNWLSSQGHSNGFGETAIGYFGAIIVTYFVRWFIMRRQGK
jgi:phosphotransferase system  glucose/maltose/N-acetylglucosamine-specific IIC component